MKSGRGKGVSAAFVFAALGVVCARAGAAEERIERLHWEDATAAVIPVSEDLVELGARTYSTRCLICHGQQGKGDGMASHYLLTKPRNFTKAIFKYRTTPQGSFPRDEDLFRAVTVGFPIYGMPSFRYLSEQERWGLVYYVKRLTQEGFRKDLAADGDMEAEEIDEIVEERLKPDRAIKPSTGPEWTAQAVAAGKKVYEELQCATCHGERGMGDGPSAAELTDEWGDPIVPVPFALNRYHMKAGGRARDIVRVLKTGVGGTPMPMYEADDEDDFWNLAYYVLELSHERAESER